MSQEKTRPTTRVSRNQTKVVRAAPIRRYRPPYENCTTRLQALLDLSRSVARKADATLPRSRLRCVRWTSIIYRRSRPRSLSTDVPGMAKLAARVQKRNGRATRAPGVGGSSPSQREDSAWHKNHLQTKNRKGRASRKLQVQIRGSGIPTNKRYPLG